MDNFDYQELRDVVKGGEQGTNNLFSCTCYGVEGFATGHGAGIILDIDAAALNALKKLYMMGLEVQLFSVSGLSRDIVEADSCNCTKWPGDSLHSCSLFHP